MGAMDILFPPCNCCNFPPFEPPTLDFPQVDEILRNNPIRSFPRHGWHPDVFGLIFLGEFAQQD